LAPRRPRSVRARGAGAGRTRDEPIGLVWKNGRVSIETEPSSSAVVLPAEQPWERRAVIDLSAIRHNVRRVAELAAPAQVMAVVKADAYGHGALPVAKAALEAGATWLGTAHVTESLALRAAGITAPLLAWLHTSDTPFEEAIAAHIDLGVSGWDLDRIAAAARSAAQPARVHLTIDTGLGRNGCTPEGWRDLLAAAAAYQEEGVLRVVGVFSHLAVADEPERPETDEQLAAFRTAVALAEDAGFGLEAPRTWGCARRCGWWPGSPTPSACPPARASPTG
jgi:alanine racemase